MLKKVSKKQSDRPIMVLFDLLSRRWALRILWELRSEHRGFREMRALCDNMPPNTLSARLNELKEAGIVENTAGGNLTLTERGRDLGAILMSMSDWSDEWDQCLNKE